MNVTDMIIPLLVVVVVLWAAVKKVDIFSSFCEGASEGLSTCKDILPALVLLMVCIAMLRSSGVIEALAVLLTPMCEVLCFPAQCIPMVLLRPFSGSGAMAVYNEIAAANGADSLAERVAAVLIGSSETTFYTIAVYFSAVKVKNTRHAVPSALTADLTAWLVCGVAVTLLMGAM